MEKIKIDIKGAYGEANFGDDLLMIVIENIFNNDNTNILLNFIGAKNNYPRKLLKISRYNDNKFNASVLVYGGGTQFFSFIEEEEAHWTKRIFNVIKRPNLIFLKFKNKLLKKSYKSTAHFGIGLGPFNNTRSENKAKYYLKEAMFIGVRDEKSLSLCEKWELPCVFGADIILSSYFKMPKLKTDRINQKANIGIIVRDWKWEVSDELYIDKLLSLKDNYDSREFNFQFIVFSPEKDKKCLNKLNDEELLIWDADKYTVESFIDKLNDFDIIISARYHGAIIGALLNKKIICIELEQKLSELTKQINGIKLWKQPFIMTELVSQIDSLIALDKPNYNSDLEKLKANADKMVSEFVNTIIKS